MWDIPSSTILAIMPECLPAEPPQGFQKETVILGDAVTSYHDKIAVIDVGGIITPYPNILSMLFGGTNIASIEAQFALSGILYIYKTIRFLIGRNATGFEFVVYYQMVDVVLVVGWVNRKMLRVLVADRAHNQHPIEITGK